MASSAAASGGDSANMRPTLTVQTPSYADDFRSTSEKPPQMDPHHLVPGSEQEVASPRESREVANRVNDDLELLRAERVVSHQGHEAERRSVNNRSHHEHVEDAFNTVPSTPAAVKEQKSTWFTKSWNSVGKFPRVLRYVVYAIPPGLLILIPVFLDLFAYNGSAKPIGGEGGVQLLWFGIWLEVVWLSLWVARIITSIMPGLFAFVANTVGSSNHKKWKDIGRQLEFSTALFFWMLVVLVSYHPILDTHRVIRGPDDKDIIPYVEWVAVVYKVITALFVLATLNWVEKILIQWIAASFHLRTYSHRIRENQMNIGFLVDLYTYAKTRIEAQDPVWDAARRSGTDSTFGGDHIKALQSNARHAWNRIGNATTRMAGDLTGRKVLKNNHPRKVVMELLRSTQSSYTLARVFYRTFVRPDRSTITAEDLEVAFKSQEEAEACFAVFDRDLNGDISMEELEMACNEIHLEKKAIAASLKDLDSVIKKLDEVFMFIIVIIVIIVFISIISGSAAAALTSTGTVILGLSWLLQATAQEFLQSIIFVFVKHPFDVGDRVTVYGNTGDMMKGDDYYVIEISLLYTEFKKMQGHVVQAPNSLLNTLFILNQRRSQGLADPINLKLAFGTSEAQIEELKSRMLEFCIQNQRDYAPRIISEVQTIDSVMSITMNIIFFHKSNYQNELLRLSRHNKFAVELMRQMKDMGLQTPQVIQPGGMREMPLYWTQAPPPPAYYQHPSSIGPNNEEGTAAAAGGGGPVVATEPSPQVVPVSSSAVPVTGSMPLASSSSLSLNQPPTPAARRRANSRAAVVEAGLDFSDVYSDRRARRDSNNHGVGLQRLTSIRQSPREEDEDELSLGERLENAPSSSGGGAGVGGGRSSMESSRARPMRIWPGGGGLGRSASSRGPPGGYGQGQGRYQGGYQGPPGGNAV